MSDHDSIADDLLRNGYERWLRLEEAKAEVSDDIKELMAELKGHGFTPKAVRESFRRVRNIGDADQQEHDAIVDLYVASLTRARPAPAHEKTLNNFGSYSEAKGRDEVDTVEVASFVAMVSNGVEYRYDAETGELTDNRCGRTAFSELPVSESAEQDDVGATASSTNSHSSDTLRSNIAGEAVPVSRAQASPADVSDEPFEPVAFLRRTMVEA